MIEPVTPERWDDLVALFERPGPRGGTPVPGTCWCMAWRGNPPQRSARREGMHELVDRGAIPGLLAYVDGAPMGWVAIAPRHDYVGLERSRTLKPPIYEARVYAITCFYIDPAMRSGGVSSALLDKAVEHARALRATAVEAYPKAGAAPHAASGGRAEENFSFMGRRAMFERRGFAIVGPAGARLVMRLDLTT